MNFFEIIKKSSTKAIEAIRSTAIYDFAEETLTPKSYAETAKPLYLLSKHFSTLYHFVSYFVNFLGLLLVVKTINNTLYIGIFLALGILLFGILEVAKSNSSSIVFNCVAREDTINKLFLFILVVSTIFSFATSVWSANKAMFHYATTDKFSNNIATLQVKVDSINNLYATQLTSLESSIKASQNTLQTTKTNWKVNTAQSDLKSSTNALNNVLTNKQKAIKEATENHTINNKKTDLVGNEVAIIAAILFAIFEILNIVAYYFYYFYLSNCLLEKNGLLVPYTPINNYNDSVIDELVINEPVKTTSLNEQIKSMPLPLNITSKPQKIGFQFNSNNDPVKTNTLNEPQPTKIKEEEIKEEEVETTITHKSSFLTDCCLHCKTKFERKTHNHTFCSTKCRISNWEVKKGKKLNFSKKP